MVGHGGSSAGSYLADPTSPIPSHCASIVATSTLGVNLAHQTVLLTHTHNAFKNWTQYAVEISGNQHSDSGNQNIVPGCPKGSHSIKVNIKACYGSKKSLVHSDGHTQVPRVGSRAKLGEGSTQRIVCEGVNLAPNF